jgi:hypothetical protein
MKTTSSPSIPSGYNRDIADRCVHVSELVAALARLPDSAPTNIAGYEVTDLQLRFELKPVDYREAEDEDEAPAFPRPLSAHGQFPGSMNAGDLRKVLTDLSRWDPRLTNLRRILPVPGKLWLTYLDEGYVDDRGSDRGEDDKNLPEYRIEGGDSMTGDIGFVAYVRARNAKAAMARLEEVSVRGDHEALTIKHEGYEICIYINVSKLTASLASDDSA